MFFYLEPNRFKDRGHIHIARTPPIPFRLYLVLLKIFVDLRSSTNSSKWGFRIHAMKRCYCWNFRNSSRRISCKLCFVDIFSCFIILWKEKIFFPSLAVFHGGTLVTSKLSNCQIQVGNFCRDPSRVSTEKSQTTKIFQTFWVQKKNWNLIGSRLAVWQSLECLHCLIGTCENFICMQLTTFKMQNLYLIIVCNAMFDLCLFVHSLRSR